MDRIFSAVLQTGIYSLGIILIIVLLRTVFKKRASKTVLCALWIFAAIRLMLPLQLESDYALLPDISKINTVENIVASENAGNNVSGIGTLQENDTAPVSMDIANGNISENYEISPEVNTKTEETEVRENSIGDTDYLKPVLDNGEESASANPNSDTGHDNAVSVLSVLGYIWLAGIAVFILLMVRRYVNVKKKLKDAVLLAPYDDVYSSDAISSAFVFGIIKPGIYVSSSIKTEQLDYVLAHERAHISRKDYITKLLAYLILSVYWFIPWVWAAYVLFGRDVELACDEKVILEKSETYRADYAQVLLDSTISYSHKEAGLVSFGEEKIKDRIESVVNYKKKSIWISVIIILLTGIALTVFFFSRNTKENGQTDNNGGIQVKLLEHASPETSCIILYRFDGEKTTRRFVFDKEWEHKVIDEVNDLKLTAAAQDELLKWSEPCYGISISGAENGEIWLTYADGLWLTKDGSLYRGKYALEKCFEEAAGFDNNEEESYDSGIRMPNAAILSKYSMKYCCKAKSEVYAEKNGVSLRAVSVDEDMATLEYHNGSGVDFTFGEVFTLQKYFDDWYDLPVAVSNYLFNLPLYILSPGADAQIKCYIGLYGKLDAGHYRIVKDDMCAEFDIPFKNADEQVVSYRGIISGESFEKGSGYDIQIIKTGQNEWKTIFVHWNRGETRQTMEKKIGFNITPSMITVPVTEVDINRDGYMDFIIDYGILGKVRKGDCIIWNTDTLKYEFLEGYSVLCNAVFDTRTGRIYDNIIEATGAKSTRNQYIIDGNKLEVVATLIEEYDRSNGVTRYTEMQKIDGEFIVVQDNLPESEVSFEGWTTFIS